MQGSVKSSFFVVKVTFWVKLSMGSFVLFLNKNIFVVF